MNIPRVTILLATYNRAHLVLETLQSIIDQTYTNWECIIVDDYSSDNTKEVIEEFIKIDNRFGYFLKTKKYGKGLSGSRNQGLDFAKSRNAKFIQFFDDDDLMHPQKFEIQMNEFQKYENIDLTIFESGWSRNSINYNEYESKIIDNIEELFLLAKIMFTAQVPIIKYEYLKEIRFDENLFYAEEWELFNKLFFGKKTRISCVSVPLYYHRHHELSITKNLYGNTNIKEVSNYRAFSNVYHFIKTTNKFNGKAFSKFITFAVNYKKNPILFKEIKEDLKNGILQNRIKENLILSLLCFLNINKRIIIKMIHRIARF